MNRTSLATFCAVSLLGGSNFLLIKISLGGLDPLSVLAARFLLGALVLGICVAVIRQRIPRDIRMWLRLIVASLIANFVPYLLFVWAEERIASNVAGSFNGATPLFAFLISLLIVRGTSWSVSRIAGLFLGILGTILIMEPWRTIDTAALMAQAACLLAAVSNGAAYVYRQHMVLNRGYSPTALTTCQLSIGAIIATGLAAVFYHHQPQLTTAVVLSTLALGILGTGAAYYLDYRLLIREGPVVDSLTMYLFPVVSLILGVIVLSEPLTWSLIAGTTTVIAGVTLSSRNELTYSIRDVIV
jgi:drug/metabolite transporter (DMT)-like permease